MPLAADQVQRLARLARIAIRPEESGVVLASLNRVLELVETMRAVDTSGIEPMAHALEAKGAAAQRLRPDAVTETDQREALQSVAPAVERGLYLVPKVIE